MNGVVRPSFCSSIPTVEENDLKSLKCGFESHLEHMGRTYSKSASGIRDERITICKNCGKGVFRNQLWRWSRNPTGIVHDEDFCR